MNYIVTNPNKKICIRLNSVGTPISCSKTEAQRFEHSKAKNILDNLPKGLRRLHFRVEAVPEINKKKALEPIQHQEPKVISNTYYSVPDSVYQWLERVKTCNNLAQDAQKRKDELVRELSNIDKKRTNLDHEIRFKKPLNASEGYKKYREWKNIEDTRGAIKDELVIVSTILDSNLSSIASKRIDKAVEGLSKRVFKMREVKEGDDNYAV